MAEPAPISKPAPVPQRPGAPVQQQTGARSAGGAVRSALRGMGFAAQEATLAPVQMKGGGGPPGKVDASKAGTSATGSGRSAAEPSGAVKADADATAAGDGAATTSSGAGPSGSAGHVADGGGGRAGRDHASAGAEKAGPNAIMAGATSGSGATAAGGDATAGGDAAKAAGGGTAVAAGDGTAKAAGATPGEISAAFGLAANALDALFEKRAIGVREVHGTLNEADQPSIGEAILQAAFMGALAAATGGISSAIGAKLMGEAEGIAAEALADAVTSGIGDFMKEGVMGVAGAISGDEGESQTSFFATLEEVQVDLKKAAKDRLAGMQRDQGTTSVGPVEAYTRAVESQLSRARQIQFEKALGHWLSAQSKATLGLNAEEEGDKGSDLGEHPDMGSDSKQVHKNDRVSGVLEIAFGMRPAARPLTPESASLSGMNDATRSKLGNTKIGALELPIVMSGMIYKDSWDAADIALTDDNDVQLGKNEAGTVWVSGDDEGIAALTVMDDAALIAEVGRLMDEEGLTLGEACVRVPLKDKFDIARDIIGEDIEPKTLDELGVE